jgi:hypothetical protein
MMKDGTNRQLKLEPLENRLAPMRVFVPEPDPPVPPPGKSGPTSDTPTRTPDPRPPYRGHLRKTHV